MGVSSDIIQIVPKLPPSISGVGDYGYLLAHQLRADYDITTHFVLCDPSSKRDHNLDGFNIDAMKVLHTEQLQELICATGMPNTILLQFSGYGYHTRGCPLWLLRGLQAWKRQNSRRRLLIMFHELFAFGAPWRSSFWLHSLQKWLTSSLAKLADQCFTNLDHYNVWLSRKVGGVAKDVITLPVFSNVGEASSVGLLSSRSPSLVIFGGAMWVKSLLETNAFATLTCCRTLGLQEIITVGSPRGTAPSLAIPIVEHGFVDNDTISKIIRSSRVGMMNYFPGHLAKSGVFAAYSALGVVPLLPLLNESDRDGCRAGRNYLIPEQVTKDMSYKTLQQIAENAWRWYQTHNLSQTASIYADVLKGLAC